jgi:serine/threonine-protein kinase
VTTTEGSARGFRKRPPFIAASVVVCLTAVYAILQLLFVRPYLWPSGHGALVAGDARFTGGSGASSMLLARPPEITDHPIGATIVRDVFPGSPAERAGLRPGDDIVAERPAGGSAELDLTPLLMAEPGEQLRIWRSAYWMGLRGPLDIRVLRAGPSGDQEVGVRLDRPPAWSSGSGVLGEWAKRHVWMLIQILVFTGAAAVLLILRSDDVTAAIALMSLAFCAAGGGGPLMGSERILPPGLREAMTTFAWIAGPIAFPLVALAILYFPRKAAILVRHRWLHFVPFLAAGPMLALGSGTALFLAGADSLEAVAVWDAAHPAAYFGSFVAALLVNVAAIAEGLVRYRALQDQNEQRRIRIVVMTAVPGVLAYAIKDGIPMAARLVWGTQTELPWMLTAVLQILVLLPAFGLAYAVAVHRVLAPRLVVRRSIQYALATRTLTALAVLPLVALVAVLVQQRNMTLAQILSGAPLFFIVMIAASAAGWRYRDRARTWLDQRFFREEYDARKILLSLVSRIRFETDPSDLTAMVVSQIDAALHPEMAAILISGVEEARLTPVTVVHGSAESLPLEGGLVSMLRWSDEPLEVFLDDPRSPARRLPPEEREWLECTGATLLVPVLGDAQALVGVLALGPKRSEEPYTAEDRQLLASIAAQIGLALDIVRLRRRFTDSSGTLTTIGAAAAQQPVTAPMMECPRCGRCEDAGMAICPNDGTPLEPVPFMPRIVDNKYRIDMALGKGGMGAVYRARDVRLDRDVALKVVRAELLGHGDSRRRFRREAQIVAKLQHPSIVSIFDYGTFADGGAYLVMELVRGEDLRQRLKREGPLPPVQMARLLTAVCAGIEAAHSEGILHRDLKPENILLTPRDGEVKVLDFGVAKLLQADTGTADVSDRGTMLTMEGMVVGTPAYMAPEQLRAQAVDARTDVFSLGVIAYEMVTGTLPFGGGSVADIALRQAKGPGHLTGSSQLAAALERAIFGALEPDPADRPPTPTAFATAVQRALT